MDKKTLENYLMTKDGSIWEKGEIKILHLDKVNTNTYKSIILINLNEKEIRPHIVTFDYVDDLIINYTVHNYGDVYKLGAVNIETDVKSPFKYYENIE